ncbi:MAG: hypothetical protein P8I03_11765 [Thalassotalea sp.]|nr:hypothetical protein [Thalassotalea sp.]
MLGKVSRKEFGFSELTFTDELGENCAIQTVNDIKHLLDESKPRSIVLGLKEPHCYALKEYADKIGIKSEPNEMGIVEFNLPKGININSTIRLNEEQVKGLIVRLEQWLENDDFTDE